ncbi:MAG: MotA/TolQ/ExbB proton channel family protein [Planctomycetes bacterium]|nr:MotA/TolQ/ExbB proton channel family protein [Planctomycetota bacterium]
MFRQFIDLGGPLMWPLVVCSVLLGAVLVERFLVVGIGHRVFGRRLSAAGRDWHRRVLPFFTDVPPSLGLLGTVVGVVRSFRLLDGHLDAEAVTAGLGVACMTTIFGLGIAILASVSRYVLDWAVGAPALVAEPT